jgi:hypothetical protein
MPCKSGTYIRGGKAGGKKTSLSLGDRLPDALSQGPAQQVTGPLGLA